MAAPDVSIEYSHRQAAHLQVTPGIPEGCIIATFNSAEPAQVLFPVEGLETLADNQWRYIFTWDHTSDLIVHFTDASAETTTVVASAQAIVNLNPTQHQIPVLDIRTDPANLWDPATGIYVFGDNDNCLQHGSEWEKPANFIFYDGSNSPEFIEPAGLRINGGWSRRFNQKGLRFYFDDYGSSDQTEYDFFASEPTSFRRLILRCGLEPRRCFTDALASEVFHDMGHLASRWAPLAVYLNGEYWGFYPLRERFDEEFIEHTHQLDSGGYALIKDGETKHGDASEFWAFLYECRQPGDFSGHDFFLHAEETIDMVSYIDWLLLNIYGATTDNGSSYNSAQFKSGDGPWQYLSWDEDGLFYSENYQADFFHFLSINSQEEYEQYLPDAIFTGSATARIRWAAPFRALLQNSEFKQLFRERYLELMNTWFSEVSLNARLTEIMERQESEMARHSQRWNWPLSNWYQIEGAELFSWFHTRPTLLNNQFDAFMEEHRSAVELVQFNGTHEPDSGIELHWATASEQNCNGYVLFRGNQADQLTPLVSWVENENLEGTGGIWQASEYFWHDESAENNQIYFYQLAWVNFFGEETFLPWIQEISTIEPPSLFINEFLASNLTGITDETGTREDWVEIYNHGPGTAHLAGYYLTDNLDQPTRWAFPDTTVNAGEFLLVWCDSDPEDGPLHTNFKLSASGETIALFSPLTQGNNLVDGRIFGSQNADVSEGRENDGHGNWINFPIPTPGASNNLVSGVEADEDFPTRAPQLISISPNPFNPMTEIRFQITVQGSLNVQIFNLRGKLVKSFKNESSYSVGQHSVTWNGRDNSGHALASGTYFLRISNNDGVAAAKLLLIK
ncbi:MAG: T9SS type A sorting domain-containing protein [bacterium]|nr:T9SS type A sorting domain-containing protein [bacterium]